MLVLTVSVLASYLAFGERTGWFIVISHIRLSLVVDHFGSEKRLSKAVVKMS